MQRITLVLNDLRLSCEMQAHLAHFTTHLQNMQHYHKMVNRNWWLETGNEGIYLKWNGTDMIVSNQM